VVIGNHVRVKVVKNKVAPPFRQAEFDIMFERGDQPRVAAGGTSRRKRGSSRNRCLVRIRQERIGQGRENAKLYLKDHPDLAVEVEAKVKEHLGVKPVVVAADEEASAPRSECDPHRTRPRSRASRAIGWWRWIEGDLLPSHWRRSSR